MYPLEIWGKHTNVIFLTILILTQRKQKLILKSKIGGS